MTTAEQAIYLGVMTAMIVMALAIVLSATLIWIIEYLPAHVRLLRMRVKRLCAWLNSTMSAA